MGQFDVKVNFSKICAKIKPHLPASEEHGTSERQPLLPTARQPRRKARAAPPREREAAARSPLSVFKMADGLSAGDPGGRDGTVAIGNGDAETAPRGGAMCEEETTTPASSGQSGTPPEPAANLGRVVHDAGDSGDRLFDDTVQGCSDHLGAEDDCRKKRCVDRYDSSESSDRSVVHHPLKNKNEHR